MNNLGKIIMQSSFFKESEEIIDLDKKIEKRKIKKINEYEHLYKALMEGFEELHI